MSLPNSSKLFPSSFPSSATKKPSPTSVSINRGSQRDQEDQHDQQRHEQYGGGAEETPEPVHDDAANNDSVSLHPAPIRPFFTIIEDEGSSEYRHPTAVHYIFSDDDTDIVTEAALRSLEASVPEQNETSKAPTEDHPPRENYIILDMEPVSGAAAGANTTTNNNNLTPSVNIPGVTGGNAPVDGNPPGTKSVSSSPGTVMGTTPSLSQFAVKSAQSLSPVWQVLDTQVMPAPTFENHGSDEASNVESQRNNGFMLKIHGTAGLPPPSADNNFVDKDSSGGQKLEQMMDQFSKRMAELRTVIDGGDQKMGMMMGRAEEGSLDPPTAKVGAEGEE